jgi:hypothetical protein
MDNQTATRVRLLVGGMIVAGLLGTILALWILPMHHIG